jgi:hypothetical protein
LHCFYYYWTLPLLNSVYLSHAFSSIKK